MQDNDTNRTIEQLQRRVQNLELFALAILIGVGVYMTQQARLWFEFQNGQSLMFGIALTFCLVVLFLRHHFAGFLGYLGLNQWFTSPVGDKEEKHVRTRRDFLVVHHRFIRDRRESR